MSPPLKRSPFRPFLLAGLFVGFSCGAVGSFYNGAALFGSRAGLMDVFMSTRSRTEMDGSSDISPRSFVHYFWSCAEFVAIPLGVVVSAVGTPAGTVPVS